MRAALMREFGPPEAIRVSEVDQPAPGAGQVLVRVTAAGVNFADVSMVRGTNRRTDPPFVPGVEAAGTVETLGADTGGDLAPGTRVVYWDPMPAAFAEFAAVDAWRCVPVPDDVSDDVAVA
jgi:NADPH:quinone reductase